jgi:S1-C subfamily serine protease
MRSPITWSGVLLILAAGLFADDRQPEFQPARYNDAISSQDYVLGVILYDTAFRDPVHGLVKGVEIDHALARYRADLSYLEPGDVIVRVNGRRVRSIAEFREQISASKGVISLRVWDLRTHAYDDYAKIPLLKSTEAPFPAKPNAKRDP